MTLAELQKLLREKDLAAVLVSSRILERVVRDDLDLPAMYWGLPHGMSYVCDRQMLYRHCEQAELDIEPGQLLPDKVILLIRPDAEEMSNIERPTLLLKYWQRLFHSRVHLALTDGRPGGPLTDAEVRSRAAQLGLTEFAEVRQVLIQDGYLPDNAGPRETLIEFAAVYLELHKFAASLLPNYFPGIKDFGKVDELLGRDVDVPALFEQTRLVGAADPAADTPYRTDESQEAYWSLVREAQKAALEDNRVKAAILRMKASRVAPGSLTLSTRREAELDVAHLTGRLAAALKLGQSQRDEWTRALTVLLEKADQGVWPVEARLLDDLQRVCEDSEREIYTLDVFEYVTSLGKRPIRRALPSQRLVRVTMHLASAVGRLGEVRVDDDGRDALSKVLTKALHDSTADLHARFRPVLMTALDDVGLGARNPVERVAFDKMVSELLDRITTHGFLSFAELRDAISRNQLKMPDTSEPESLWRGDPLIRLDGRLTSLLDGVYRPSDFYIRWLERGTALLFGTPVGRLLTRFLLIPLLLAWMILHMLGLGLDWVFPPKSYPSLHPAALVLLGPLHSSGEPPAGPDSHAPPEADHADPPHPAWHFGLLAAVALLLLGLLEWPRFRRRVLRMWLVLWRGRRWLFWDWPFSLVPVEAIQRVVGGWMFQGVFWVLFLPGVICGVTAWFRPEWFTHWAAAAGVFLGVSVALNSRFARWTLDGTRDVASQLTTLVRAGLLPGLLRLIVEVFKKISDGIEAVMYAVDEWLRFRTGEGPWIIGLRAVLSVLWFPIAFVIRFIFVVLIEPGINPLKLPISFLAGKVLLPMYGLMELDKSLSAPLSPFLGAWLAYWLVVCFLTMSPDVFGFLGWEMQENWRLYRANRAKTLQPQPVGAHGETLRGLLQPGFHSGTVPLLYAHLRVAERLALRSRNWSKVRQYLHDREHLVEALSRFLARELVALLKKSRVWQGVPVEAGEVFLATNRVRFEVIHSKHARPVQIEIQHHHGWLVAGLRDAGWLSKLTGAQLDVFIICLAGFYKQADVDLVREQLKARLPGPVASLEFTEDELLVRPDADAEPIHYPLRDALGFPNTDGPLHDKVFAWSPIRWADWVGGWQADQDTGGHPGLPGIGLWLVNLDDPPISGASYLGLSPPPGPPPAG